MSFELTRRKLILSALGGVASIAGVKELSQESTLEAISGLFIRDHSLQSLLDTSVRDKADKNTSYLSGTDMSEWHQEIHPVLARIARSGIVPAQGKIIELGSYQGKSLRVLNKLFGAERVRGCDIHNYTHNSQITIQDVRSENFHMDTPALVWSDVSNWTSSPRSKLAAFNWAKKNLVSGGIYIDDRLRNLPSDLDLSGFKLIYSQGYVSVFRKT